MYWEDIKTLNDLEKCLTEYTNIPTKIVDKELHFLINNKDFKSFEEDLGDNILIRITNLEIYDYNIRFTVIAEKDGVELINLNTFYNTDWEANTSKEVWDYTFTKLIEANIIPPNELQWSGYSISSTYDTNIINCERIAMKCFKDIFGDYSPNELEKIYHDMLNEDPGFWIDVTFLNVDNCTTATITVFVNNAAYYKTYETNLFEIKDMFKEIRIELEQLCFCKERSNY